MNPDDDSLRSPDLSWNDQGLPISQQFDDPYFSIDDGLNESRYVFLQGNQLPKRWGNNQEQFNIVETGFGTGLNFLMTWQSLAIHKKQAPEPGHQWLHFTSIEKYPLNTAEMTQALALWPELAELAELLLSQYPQPVPGFHQLVWPEHKVQLTLIFADLHQALPQLSGPVHAWYLDGFAPSRNPAMWAPELFRQMRRLAICYPYADTSVATFTAAGIVRRGLTGAGFHVSKTSGFGRKREMLIASYQRTIGPERPPIFIHKPWLLPSNSQSHRISNRDLKETPLNKTVEKKATIIGAGLAGCSTARALAERGYQVTLLDTLGIAQGASGNPQGGLYVKLAASQQASHTDFYLAAFQYSSRHIPNTLNDEAAFRACGVLQLAYDSKEAERQRKFLQTRSLPKTLVHAVNAEEASALAGCPQTTGGLFFPQAGWVDPRALCQAWVKHPGIEHKTLQVTALKRDEKQWQLEGQDHKGNKHMLEAQTVVIATAHQTRQLLPDAYLPTRSIRGQLSLLDSRQVSDIHTVLCARSYMAPAHRGHMCLGATYHINDDETAVRASDHQTNLNHLEDFGPVWQNLSRKEQIVTGGRIGFRCTTPDYLPMVGPVPDVQGFITVFQPMVKNARHIPATIAPVMPDLWLNIGHGSRGLASAPLCAQILAAQITGGSSPISQNMQETLWPGRFLLRDMVRRKL